MKPLILVVIGVSFVFSAQFNFSKSGYFNDPSVWNENSEFPGKALSDDFDNFTMNSSGKLTIPQGVEINKVAGSLTGKSSAQQCTLAVNGYLHLSGDLNLNNYSVLIVGPGAILDLNGHKITGTGSSIRKIEFNGNEDSRIKVKSTEKGGAFIFCDSKSNISPTWIKINYCDFSDLNVINLSPWSDQCTFILDHSTITNCGELTINHYNPAVNIEITNSDFRESRNSSNGAIINWTSGGGSETPTGKRCIRHCTFSNTTGAILYISQKGITIEQSVFNNVNLQLPKGNFLFRNNALFQSQPYDKSKLFGDVFNGKIVNNILWSDRNNPHWFTNANGLTIDSNVIINTYEQGFGDAGDFIVTHESDTLFIRYNIFIDSASGVILNQVGGTSGGVAIVHNNTWYGNASKPKAPPYYGCLARNESGGKFGGKVLIYKNICYNNSNSAAGAGINIETEGENQIDSVDSNIFYNIAAPYYKVKITTSGNYDSTSLQISPKFQNLSWKFSKESISSLLNINQYKTLSKKVSTDEVEDIVRQARQSFAPTNTQIDPGIGAINPLKINVIQKKNQNTFKKNNKNCLILERNVKQSSYSKYYRLNGSKMLTVDPRNKNVHFEQIVKSE